VLASIEAGALGLHTKRAGALDITNIYPRDEKWRIISPMLARRVLSHCRSQSKKHPEAVHAPSRRLKTTDQTAAD
jgi:hypothetical protein